MTSTRARLWTGSIFVLAGIGFASIGWIIAGLQHYRLATYQPVSATVLESHVKTSQGTKGGVSYEPIITYQYDLQNVRHQSKRVLPMGGLGMSGDWAWDICAVSGRPENHRLVFSPQSRQRVSDS